MRTLEQIANDTPPDYITHGFREPERLAIKMIQVATQQFPNKETVDNISVGNGSAQLGVQDVPHMFLLVGPGSGPVIQQLLQAEQVVSAIDTSRKSIHLTEETVRPYINWMIPWETNYKNQYFHICLVNKYWKSLLHPDEWEATRKELKRVSRILNLF